MSRRIPTLPFDKGNDRFVAPGLVIRADQDGYVMVRRFRAETREGDVVMVIGTLKMQIGSTVAAIGTGPCTADSSGAFADCTFTIPLATGGAHTVYASDGTNTASTTFTVTSSITLVKGATGVPGSMTTVSGSGFAASTTVNVMIGDASAPSACVTNARGAFSNCVVTIPTVYTVVASDGSGDTAQQSLTLK